MGEGWGGGVLACGSCAQRCQPLLFPPPSPQAQSKDPYFLESASRIHFFFEARRAAAAWTWLGREFGSVCSCVLPSPVCDMAARCRPHNHFSLTLLYIVQEKAFDERGALRQDKALSINKIGHGASAGSP